MRLGWFFTQNETCRSSRPEVFCKKDVLRNFVNFTGKHLCQSLIFNKVAAFRPQHPLWLLLNMLVRSANFSVCGKLVRILPKYSLINFALFYSVFFYSRTFFLGVTFFQFQLHVLPPLLSSLGLPWLSERFTLQTFGIRLKLYKSELSISVS